MYKFIKLNLFSNLVLISSYILFFLLSCRKDNVDVQSWVKPKWEFNLHKQNAQSNSIIDANLVFDNKVILGTTDGPDNRFISCIDIRNGSEIWRWNDIYQAPTEYFDIRYALFYDNLMFYQVGTRSYCIKLNDGSTYFKKRGTVSYDSRFSAYLSNAILLGDLIDTITGEIVFGANTMNIHTGIIKPLLSPPFDSASLNTSFHGLGDFSNIAITNDGRYLVTTYAYADTNQYVISKLGLFDLNTNSWVYSGISLTDNPKWYTSVFHIPVVYDNKIFMNIGKSLICHDFMTGKKIWTREFPHDFLFSGYIIEDDQLLANCENGVFYCLNPQTGSIKWTAEGAGTSSPLRYLNGIVYFSGGSTGRIHGIDTATGEYVWRLDPDNYDHASDFKPDIYVYAGENGSEGKVIICTPEKAYCLPAYR